MTTRERRRKTAEQLAEILEKHFAQFSWREALFIFRAVQILKKDKVIY
jgi:5-carboxymethyl-2-hydroxymuconate isomerase